MKWRSCLLLPNDKFAISKFIASPMREMGKWHINILEKSFETLVTELGSCTIQINAKRLEYAW